VPLLQSQCKVWEMPYLWYMPVALSLWLCISYVLHSTRLANLYTAKIMDDNTDVLCGDKLGMFVRKGQQFEKIRHRFLKSS